jgi:adiponectin receptor
MYATGVPERFKPGMFDLLGASHQIFHVCIVLCFTMFHASNIHLWSILSSEEAAAGLRTTASTDPTAF